MEREFFDLHSVPGRGIHALQVAGGDAPGENPRGGSCSIERMALGSASVAPVRGGAGTLPRRSLSWLAQARAILQKDLAIELSTGEVVITSGFFALLVVVMASLAFFGGPASGRGVASGVVWLSLAFSAGLGVGESRGRGGGAAAARWGFG